MRLQLRQLPSRWWNSSMQACLLLWGLRFAALMVNSGSEGLPGGRAVLVIWYISSSKAPTVIALPRLPNPPQGPGDTC